MTIIEFRAFWGNKEEPFWIKREGIYYFVTYWPKTFVYSHKEIERLRWQDLECHYYTYLMERAFTPER